MKSHTKRLEQLQDTIRQRPILAATTLRHLGLSLLPDYQPRFDISLLEDLSFIISELDTTNILEVTEEVDMDDYLYELFQEVINEINTYRESMKEVLMLYKYEKKEHIGNRLVQLSDVLIGSFQTGLSKDELNSVYSFIEMELHHLTTFLVDYSTDVPS